MLKVEQIPPTVVYQYVEQNQDVDAPEYEQTVLCLGLLKSGLEHGHYAHLRSCFGLFMDSGEMLGYCVITEREKTLDFLHIKKEARGVGLSKWFLGNFDIETVWAEPDNTVARSLYSKLGYRMEEDQ